MPISTCRSSKSNLQKTRWKAVFRQYLTNNLKLIQILHLMWIINITFMIFWTNKQNSKWIIWIFLKIVGHLWFKKRPFSWFSVNYSWRFCRLMWAFITLKSDLNRSDIKYPIVISVLSPEPSWKVIFWAFYS